MIPLTAQVAYIAALPLAATLGLAPMADSPDPVERSWVPTMVILDASGSMNAADSPGPRIDAAKDAIATLVSSLPAGAELGLQVYGAGTGSAPEELAAGCKDIETLIPVGPVDAEEFIGVVNGVDASGYTPIGAALEAAADELPKEGPRAIVLVSDGEDTCAPPPPCEVARDLAEQGVDLNVHTIGFRVDDAARAELECIAEVANGTYMDAGDSTELANALRIQVDHAIEGYAASGTPVQGTAMINAETPILQPGQYTDTLETGSKDNLSDGTRAFYRIDVPEGWTAHAAATMLIPHGAEANEHGSSNLHLIFLDAERMQCGRDTSHHNWTIAAGTPSTAAVSHDGCERPAYIEIHRNGSRFEFTPATVEIMLRLEPPADASSLPAPEVRDAPVAPQHGGDFIPVAGGLSFNQATELVPGESYSSTFVAGEYRFYRVPLEWGQQLSFRVDLTGRDDTASREWNAVRGYWFNPLRRDIEDLRLTVVDTGGTGASFERGSTEPVRYGSEFFGADGDYYFMLGANAAREDDPFQYSFLITVETHGEPEEGPVYDTSALAPPVPPSEDDAAPEPDSEPESGAETVAPREPDEADEPDAAGSGMPGWLTVLLWAGLGIVVIAVGAVTVALLRSRRNA